MAPILGIWASSRPAAAVDTGAMFPLQVITVGPAGASSVSFTNIPSTYAHLQVRIFAKRTTAGTGSTYGLITFNSDSATANYRSHELYGSGTSAIASDYSGYAGVIIQRLPNAGETSIFGTTIVDILDYANTNKNTTVRSLGGFDANGSGAASLNSTVWLNTNAITSITVAPASSDFAQYSQIALYGIKAAS